MMKLILYLFLGFNLARPSYQTLTTFTVNQFYTSCSDTTNTLPNLQHAKRPTTTVVSDIACVGGYTAPSIFTITWYYYSTPPAVGQCVTHDTTTSTINFTTNVFVNSGGNTIGTRTGTVIDGALLGKKATFVTTTADPNIAVCSSDIGLEARSGTIVLTISDTGICVPLLLPCVTCSGVITLEYCPGLRGT